jgi:hypothetical protein
MRLLFGNEPVGDLVFTIRARNCPSTTSLHAELQCRCKTSALSVEGNCPSTTSLHASFQCSCESSALPVEQEVAQDAGQHECDEHDNESAYADAVQQTEQSDEHAET